MKKFINLKLHTNYSILEGVGSLTEHILKMKKDRHNVIAITDTALFSSIEFYNLCKKNDIKPIIGLEIFFMGEKENKEVSIILLAKNNKGYKNLIKLSSLSFNNKNMKRNKINYNELLKYKEGLIALVGSINSEIIKLLENNLFDYADQILKKYMNDFDDIYLDLPTFNIDNKIKQSYIELAENNNVNTIFTNEIYYPNKEDMKLQILVRAVDEGVTISKVQTAYKYNDLYIKNDQEILNGNEIYNIDLIEKSMENTIIIGDKCNVTISFGEFKFPEYKLPDNINERDYLRELVYKNINKKYNDINEEIINRIEYELSVINQMGYNGYFIIVWDFIKYAKDKGIYVGPGRGSAAGSIIAYLLNITEVDPIKYELIFERFLNKERISMPDIDIDFENERREEVISYVRDKYGINHVAHIITFGTMKAKLALRDIARALGISKYKIEGIIKLIDARETLAQNLKNNSKLREKYNNENDVRILYDYALRLENTNRNISTHAAGIVITKNELHDDIPTYKDENGIYMTQFQMKELEELGILKMDFLGLKNLTIIRKTVDLIKLKDNNFNINNIKYDDKKTFDLFNKGETLGIFQFESKGITELTKKMKVDKFEDISILLSLYRPGPLQSGMVYEFINSKHGINKVEYNYKVIEEVLKETHGLILYQEQVMNLAHKMANYTLGEADELRKAMGKKIRSILENNRIKFIKQSIENDIDEDTAKNIYDMMENFGGYGFNKSHSISYSVIAYMTAYLKANYPLEFYASLMTNDINALNRLNKTINEAKNNDIIITLPDVNTSMEEFSVQDGKIVYGLLAIKGIGISTIKEIIDTRNEAKFDSYKDFIYRMYKKNITKKQIESLILSGALDNFEYNRREKFNNIDNVLKWAKKEFALNEDIAKMLFTPSKTESEEFNISKESDFMEKEIIKFELEYIGVNLSIDLFIKYKEIINLFSIKENYIVGIITELEIFQDKNDKNMAKFNIIDNQNNIYNMIVFNNVYMNNFDKISEYNLVIIKTKKLDNKYSVLDMIDLKNINKNDNIVISLLLEYNKDEINNDIKVIINDNPGNNKIIVYIKDGNKITKKMLNKRILLNDKILLSLIKIVGFNNIRLMFG